MWVVQFYFQKLPSLVLKTDIAFALLFLLIIAIIQN